MESGREASYIHDYRRQEMCNGTMRYNVHFLGLTVVLDINHVCTGLKTLWRENSIRPNFCKSCMFIPLGECHVFVTFPCIPHTKK